MGKASGSVLEKSVFPALPSQKWYHLEMNKAWFLRVELLEMGCLVSNAPIFKMRVVTVIPAL